MWRPDDPPKVRWDLFIILLALYNSYSIPFEIALEPEAMESMEMAIMNAFIDFFFLLDIFASFRTTYLDRYTGDEITDTREIAKNYLSKQFWVDFFSTVPFDTLGSAITGQKSWFLQLLACLKLVRVMRLSRMIQRLNTKDYIKTSLKLFLMIFYTILYLHLVACLWFYNVKFNNDWIPVSRYSWQD